MTNIENLMLFSERFVGTINWDLCTGIAYLSLVIYSTCIIRYLCNVSTKLKHYNTLVDDTSNSQDIIETLKYENSELLQENAKYKDIINAEENFVLAGERYKFLRIEQLVAENKEYQRELDELYNMNYMNDTVLQQIAFVMTKHNKSVLKVQEIREIMKTLDYEEGEDYDEVDDESISE